MLSVTLPGRIEVFDVDVDVTIQRSTVTSQALSPKTFDQLLPFRIQSKAFVEMDSELSDHFLSVAVGSEHIRIPEGPSASHVDVERGAAPNVDDSRLGHRSEVYGV